MPESDLSELVAGRSEDLGVEYKAWMDTSQPQVRAKLARHIAALANHGGGYLISGVDDKTRQPQGATELDAVLFNQDAISAIVKRFLEPRIQIRVDHVEHAGVPYPVVIVPSHDARPVITVNDGPR
jgi:predicted HTH transcriptional regulator